MSLLNTDATAATAAPSARDQLAESIYPPAPAAPRATSPNAAVDAVRRADPARLLYKPESNFGPSVRELALATNPTGAEPELARQTAELAAVAADLGMTRDDVDRLAAIARSHKARPPTDEQLAEYQRTAIQQLRAAHGGQFDQVFRDARALAQRDNRFAAYLDKAGMADHPFVVTRVAELAQAARNKR